MKEFESKKGEKVFYIERRDIEDEKFYSKLKGWKVDIVFAPKELKEDEKFNMLIANAISLFGNYWGDLFYYE